MRVRHAVMRNVLTEDENVAGMNGNGMEELRIEKRNARLLRCGRVDVAEMRSVADRNGC